MLLTYLRLSKVKILRFQTATADSQLLVYKEKFVSLQQKRVQGCFRVMIAY